MSENRYDYDDDSFRTDAAPPVPYPKIITNLTKPPQKYPKKQSSDMQVKYIIKESTCTICGKKVRHKGHDFNHI